MHRGENDPTVQTSSSPLPSVPNVCRSLVLWTEMGGGARYPVSHRPAPPGSARLFLCIIDSLLPHQTLFNPTCFWETSKTNVCLLTQMNQVAP